MMMRFTFAAAAALLGLAGCQALTPTQETPSDGRTYQLAIGPVVFADQPPATGSVPFSLNVSISLSADGDVSARGESEQTATQENQATIPASLAGQ